MGQEVEICVIDAVEDRRAGVAQLLRDAGYAFVEAGDLFAGTELLRRVKPQIVFCAGQAGVPAGATVCQHLRSQVSSPHPYFILVADQTELAALDASTQSGADDLLALPCAPAQLRARLEVALRTSKLRADLERANITDPLTGLHNHCHFSALLDVEFARSRRYGAPLSVLMIDLDFFKAVNDTFGHQVGNEVLKKTAVALQAGVRDADTVSRYGGEEFAVIVPEAALDAAAEMAERLRADVEADVACPEMREQRITASFGVASIDDPRVVTPADLVELADRAMYLSKHSGRNRVATSLEVCDLDDHDRTESNDELFSLRKQVVELSMQAREVFVQSVWALVQALEAKDPYTAYHSRNVTQYAEELARHLALSPPLVRAIRHAAMLHDLGKIGLPDAVLMKREGLTENERQLLRRVPMITSRILSHMRILETELQAIRHQREHYDGSGHPAGLVGDQIPIGSRILLVADAFDSMTTDRVYRGRRSIEEALAEIELHAGTQFDPRVVDALHAEAAENSETWQARIDAAHRHARQSRRYELVT